jgi:ketosteroid isomerase-like protein
MKKSLFFLVLISLSAGLFAQKKEVSAIKNVLQRQEQAWNVGDIPRFMEGYWKSDSLLFVSKAGPIYGWQGAFDRYKKTYPDRNAMGTLAFNLLRFDRLSPTSYFVLGKWHLKRLNDDLGGTFTLLFKKIGGKWLIVADHTS